MLARAITTTAMTDTITHLETLEYYDGDLLFVAANCTFWNGYLLCMNVDRCKEYDRFVCVPISVERLLSFYRGELDLREIFEYALDGQPYVADINDYTSPNPIYPHPRGFVPEDWLPGAGYFMDWRGDTPELPQLP